MSDIFNLSYHVPTHCAFLVKSAVSLIEPKLDAKYPSEKVNLKKMELIDRLTGV